MHKRTRIVVVGGGTGTRVVLSGLKTYADTLDITAIIAATDSGGSSGRLREEFGYLPLGDVRQALVALGSETEAEPELLRRLFEHRFISNGDLSGHSLGNLILIALTEIFGGEEAAVAAAENLLRARGKVLPVTHDNVHLAVTYEDGTTAVGEYEIGEPKDHTVPKKIQTFGLSGTATITEAAEEALREADLIVFGPGDLYTSILANCIVGGFKEALADSGAKTAFIANLMTRPGQTDGLTLSGHVELFERYAGIVPQTILINSTTLPKELLAPYAARNQYPVLMEHTDLSSEVILGDFLSATVTQGHTGDIARSFIHHDGHKLAQALLRVAGESSAG